VSTGRDGQEEVVEEWLIQLFLVIMCIVLVRNQVFLLDGWVHIYCC